MVLGSNEDVDKCKAAVEVAANDKSADIVGEDFDADYTTNVPYAAPAGTAICSGKFEHYTEKDVEKIKYEVSAFFIFIFYFSIASHTALQVA